MRYRHYWDGVAVEGCKWVGGGWIHIISYNLYKIAYERITAPNWIVHVNNAVSLKINPLIIKYSV